MRFWDSSALAPLIVSEPRTTEFMRLLRFDQRMAVWWGARTDCASALRAAERADELEAAAVRRAVTLLDSLAEAWTEMLPTPRLRSQAERCLALHPLGSSQSLQLAAALAWRQGDPAGAELVTVDETLADAASREGFRVLPG